LVANCDLRVPTKRSLRRNVPYVLFSVRLEVELIMPDSNEPEDVAGEPSERRHVPSWRRSDPDRVAFAWYKPRHVDLEKASRQRRSPLQIVAVIASLAAGGVVVAKFVIPQYTESQVIVAPQMRTDSQPVGRFTDVQIARIKHNVEPHRSVSQAKVKESTVVAKAAPAASRSVAAIATPAMVDASAVLRPVASVKARSAPVHATAVPQQVVSVKAPPAPVHATAVPQPVASVRPQPPPARATAVSIAVVPPKPHPSPIRAAAIPLALVSAEPHPTAIPATAAPLAVVAVKPHPSPVLATAVPLAMVTAKPQHVITKGPIVAVAPPRPRALAVERSLLADSIAYAGRWEAVRGRTDGRMGGMSERSHVPGATATFSFSGRGITIYGVRGLHGGYGRIAIDGVVRSPLLSFRADAKRTHVPIFVTNDLSDTAHRVVITVLAQGPPGYVNVESAEVRR